MAKQNDQHAPFPEELADLVDKLKYRPGWTFELDWKDRGQGSRGLTLIIRTLGYNSYHTDQPPTYGVAHFMLVPPANYNRRSWQRWLFQQLLLVEQHECQEFFTIDGERPYAPLHGPGNDPYLIPEYATDEERRTRFTGQINPE